MTRISWPGRPLTSSQCFLAFVVSQEKFVQVANASISRRANACFYGNGRRGDGAFCTWRERNSKGRGYFLSPARNQPEIRVV